MEDEVSEYFVDGKLVNLGSSLTEPHAILDALEPDDVEDTRLEDLKRLSSFSNTPI